MWPVVFLLIFHVISGSASNYATGNASSPGAHIPHNRHRDPFKGQADRYLENSLYEQKPLYCRRDAECQPLETTKCMGAKLPYQSTTLDLIDLASQAKVQEKLQIYEQYLRYIPKCWAVIQPFLCALYMPKCENGQVDLPSEQMCKITMKPCKLIYNSSVFPEFFNCEDERLFPPKCKNDIHEMKFNITGHCMNPLIETDKPDWWFKDIEGCGLDCKNSSKYTSNEHNQIQKLILYCALLCIILHVFAITTFAINWKTANRYPAKGIFYVNVCFAISYGGYLMQFLAADTREDIVCKKDGTLRKSEPSATENLSCVIVFFIIYYFLIAGLVWFMIFAYAWYMSSLQALAKTQNKVNKRRAYFHLLAWSLPLILTITTMAIGEIDGDYITGICFVGFENMMARVGLFVAPLCATVLLSTYIIIRGVILLIKLKIESREVVSQHSAQKIQSNIMRMTVFTIFMLMFCIVTIGYHVHISMNRQLWHLSLENYIVCKLTSFSTDYPHCKQLERPSLAMLQLYLLAVFGQGIAMASWVWCDATLHAWGRYIRKKFHCEVETPMKIQKHKIISRVFAGRKKFNEGGRISIFSENHTDPVGLQFELNSGASNELSTTWAKNLPRLVNRRPAIPNDVGEEDNSYSQSIESDYSLNYRQVSIQFKRAQDLNGGSCRHVSIESRRNSGDSQVSVQIAELKATKRVKSRRTRRNDKNRYRRYSRNASGSSRAYGRRTATAELDASHIEQLLKSGKLLLPPATVPCSEDENLSVTISETAVNMRVANPNLDLNDHFTISQLSRGFHFDQVSSTDSEPEVEKAFNHVRDRRYSRSDRDSPSSRKSRKSRRSRRNPCDPLRNHRSDSESSSCPEIKQLVQSSMNSNGSAGLERNRGSRQSKTSTDVAVQANAHDLDLEMKSNNKTDKLTCKGDEVDSAKKTEKI
ncbi:hypothetical protein YQE_12680, partial [Dendroctonus ponderosae]